jgi:putative heme-binding domain-containing protein
MVMARVQHSDPGLRRAALELLKSRPKWSASALQIGKQWLAASELTEEHRTGLAALAGTFFDSSEFQAALRGAVREGSLDVRNFVLDLAGRQPPPRDTATWSSMLRDALTNEPVRLAAVRVAVAWRLTALQDRLRQLAEDSAQPLALRKEALRGVIASYSPPPPAVFRFLLDELRGADAITSADLLRKARLTDEQLIEALGVTNTMVPPASLLGAFHTSTSTQRTRDLLDVVSKLPPAGWSADQYSEFLRRIPPDLRGQGEALRKRFEPDREAQQMRMANYEPLLKGGDSDRGHTVFKSARTACLTCHAVGNTGGRIGPDLTRLGAIRSGRDILESILFPSSTFAQHYEPFTIETNDGEEHTGTLVEQDERRLVLRNVSGNEITFPRSAVKQLRRTPVSVMPEGLEAALTDAEFRDLLAYLQNLK